MRVAMTIQTRYKFIHFEIYGSAWLIHNNKTDDVLGSIQWYLRWKQFVFVPTVDVLFSADCLSDIQRFIEILGKRRRDTAP